MTLDEIVEKLYNNFLKEYYLDAGNKTTKDVIRQACLEYAFSVVPTEKEMEDVEDCEGGGYSRCRTQILSRIEEDSK